MCQRHHNTARFTSSLAVPLLPMIALTLSACSTTNGFYGSNESSGLPQETITSDEVRQYVQEWRDAKAGIQRLNELEADLALLIAEVNRASALEETPQPYRDTSEDELLTAAPLISAKSEESSWLPPTSVPADDSQPASDIDNGQNTAEAVYGLRIATFLKPQSAKFGWYLIQQRDGNILTGLSARLQKTQHPRQTLYSLNVGPFSSAPDAESLCEQLKPRQYLCEVGEFSGQELR